jgi:hypothetical protein
VELVAIVYSIPTLVKAGAVVDRMILHLIAVGMVVQVAARRVIRVWVLALAHNQLIRELPFTETLVVPQVVTAHTPEAAEAARMPLVRRVVVVDQAMVEQVKSLQVLRHGVQTQAIMRELPVLVLERDTLAAVGVVDQTKVMLEAVPHPAELEAEVVVGIAQQMVNKA